MGPIRLRLSERDLSNVKQSKVVAFISTMAPLFQKLNAVIGYFSLMSSRNPLSLIRRLLFCQSLYLYQDRKT